MKLRDESWQSVEKNYFSKFESRRNGLALPRFCILKKPPEVLNTSEVFSFNRRLRFSCNPKITSMRSITSGVSFSANRQLHILMDLFHTVGASDDRTERILQTPRQCQLRNSGAKFFGRSSFQRQPFASLSSFVPCSHSYPLARHGYQQDALTIFAGNGPEAKGLMWWCRSRIPYKADVIAFEAVTVKRLIDRPFSDRLVQVMALCD